MILVKKNNYELFHGDARKIHKDIGENKIHSIITSPPYWEQRDYGSSDQIGNETTLDEYISNLFQLFENLKKSLRDDGTVWVNIGDRIVGGQVLGIPWKFAFFMQSKGWFLKQYFPWVKRNGIPRGGNNRPHDNIETIFMFSKTNDYYYDQLSAKLEAGLATRNFRNGDSIILEPEEDYTVFDVLTRKNLSPHFSTFPIQLSNIIVRASTSDHGCCSVCGKNFIRIVEKKRYATRSGSHSKKDESGKAYRDNGRHITEVKHIDWKQSCECKNASLVSPIILDPCNGLGTTGASCLKYKRKYIGIDVNEDYLKETDCRLQKIMPIDIFESNNESNKLGK